MRNFMTDRTPPLTHRVLPLLIGLMMGACAGPEGTTRSTGVAPSPAQPESASGLTAKQQDWASSSGHVRLISIEGGGHTVPQAAYRFPRMFGATFQSDAVLESIWALFGSDTH